MSYLIVIITVKKLQNRLHRDETSDRHEDKHMDTKTKQKYQKTTLPVVDAGSPDPDYLYYPLNVDIVTQKGSLVPANIR